MFTCYIPTQKEKHFILLTSSPDPAYNPNAAYSQAVDKNLLRGHEIR